MSTAPFANTPEFSVSELSGGIKRTLESAYGYVRVRGEVSRPRTPASGHIYLTLKDDKAVLDGVIWRGVAGRLAAQPVDGLEVIATGRITTFASQSKYQLVIEALEPAGEGALLKLLEERKRKLAAEGLFAAERKRSLPYLPRTIGVVTSPTGAVIRDILHRIADRFPRTILVWPVRVQGEAAAAEIAAAIAGFAALDPAGPVPRPDVLIVARGGGSLEDLMAFNEESVVRAAAACPIPLISAVGHETDTTLIDFAADQRAPTPTAAAEMAVPVLAELRTSLAALQQRRFAAMTRGLGDRRVRLESLRRGLGEPLRLLESAMQRLDGWSERLERALPARLDREGVRVTTLSDRHRRSLPTLVDRVTTRLTMISARLPRATALLARPRLRAQLISDRLRRGLAERPVVEAGRRLRDLSGRLHRAGQAALTRPTRQLEQQSQVLRSLSHEAVLERGFALVIGPSGTPVKDAALLSPGDRFALMFRRQGQVAATVNGPEAVERLLSDANAGAVRSSNLKGAQGMGSKSPKRRPSAAAPGRDKQGSLF